ncbi:hypothetical protein [Microbacterium sp. Se5.02b]|uniref:hypothetical protein n=1 Tax=Microbacterium sp. Se5.02b TaxID=2864103 RepID=UPI00215DC5CF|nr:hypothetical protein [Microbacterium sp. Se5.02b]
MPRRRAAHASAAPRRGARHGRHGRLGRSEVVRPPLAPLDGRIDRFDLTVSTAVEFLRGTWPELQDVRFEIGAIPGFDATEEVPRWYLDRERGRIVLFRLPIERLLPRGTTTPRTAGWRSRAPCSARRPSTSAASRGISVTSIDHRPLSTRKPEHAQG